MRLTENEIKRLITLIEYKETREENGKKRNRNNWIVETKTN